MKIIAIIAILIVSISGCLFAQSPDLAFHDLRGNVKDCTINNNISEKTIGFDEQGVWKTIDGVIISQYYDEIVRNEKNQLIELITYEPESDSKTSEYWGYDEKGRIYSFATELFSNRTSFSYEYSNDRISVENYVFVGGGRYEESQTFYTYHEFDSHGNWTRRTAVYKEKGSAQENTWNETRTITYHKTTEVPVIAPYFSGGSKTVSLYFQEYFNYPKKARKNKIQGKVVVKFAVETDGRIVDPVIVTSLDPELDNEALRFVKLLPKMNPAMRNGKPVRSYTSLALKLEL